MSGRWRPWRRRGRGEGGYAAVLAAIVVSSLGMACAAVGVDTANWYVEMQKVQNAADAAALGGVPFLPQDLASAKARAIEIAEDNGYPNSGNSTVTVTAGKRSTQLKVAITSRFPNQFGAVIGVPRAAVTKTAVADYQGPAPMGSPCNSFGNEPNPGDGPSSPYPRGTVQSSSMASYCSRAPQFWGTIQGPQTGKAQGDRYQTKRCEDTGVDGCTGDVNDEYDDDGYTFVVRVAPEAVGKYVLLQLYDPMFVNTDATCSLLPTATVFGTFVAALPVAINPYVTNADGAQRYTRDGRATTKYGASSSYCSGDRFPGAGTGSVLPQAMTTSFTLRQQDDSRNPGTAAVQRDDWGNPCIHQYGSYSTARTSLSDAFPTIPLGLFRTGNPLYKDDVASAFHNWVDYCGFTPQRAGDYYLQVRTNVALGGAWRSGDGLVRYGNTATLGAGNTTAGEGRNSFAVRAVLPAGLESAVSVSGYEHMPISIAGPDPTATFHLIRVLPGAAGQKISFSYFDAGDGASTGSVTVLVPDDGKVGGASMPAASAAVRFPGGCTSYGGSAGGSAISQVTLTDCSAPITRPSGSSTSRNNGKVQTITIPIPSTYECSSFLSSGCWYKVRVGYGGTTVTDVTTWDATVIGDPVRLVE